VTKDSTDLSEREPKPEPIDLAAIARRHKLKLQETDLVDLAELRDLAIGQTMVAIPEMFYGQRIMRPVGLSDYVFQRYYDMNEWVAETLSLHNSSDQIAAFVTEKADPKVRSFDEAKEDVIKYWRYQQAVKLAMADAQKVADQINSSGQSLTELHENDAMSVGEFTHHTSTSLYPELAAGGDPMATPPVEPTMVQTSPSFMESAFGLEVNKAGVAPDYYRDNVFVVQVTGVDTRTDEELKEAFFNEINVNKGLGQGVRALFSVDQSEFMDRYFAEIDKELELKWLAH